MFETLDLFYSAIIISSPTHEPRPLLQLLQTIFSFTSILLPNMQQSRDLVAKLFLEDLSCTNARYTANSTRVADHVRIA